MATLQCQACGTAVPYDEPIPRDSECEGCHRDLRCCMNCRHHDPSRNNACRETEAELVEDKTRRNFCEFFSFNRRSFVAGQGVNPREAQARAELERPFGGPAAPGGGRLREARGVRGPLRPPPADENDE